MKISSVYKIKLATSNDDSMPHLFHPFIDKKNSVMVATDGRVIAVVPVELSEKDCDGYVSKESTVGGSDVSVRKRHTVLSTDRRTTVIPRPSVQGTVPYEQVIPTLRPGDSSTFTVCLNPSLLMNLAKAIGSKNSVVLSFKVCEASEIYIDPILIIPPDSSNKAIGAMMPIRHNRIGKPGGR
jgi:hypothetical protein